VASLSFNLKTIFVKDANFDVLGSNVGVHIPKFEGGYFLPDLVIVKGLPNFMTSSDSFITNSYLILEVL